MVKEFLNDIADWSERYGADNCVNHLIEIMRENLTEEQLKTIANELWEYEF